MTACVNAGDTQEPLTVTAWYPNEVRPELDVASSTTVPVPEEPTQYETDTFTKAPGSRGGNMVRLGVPTRVTASVRELVRVHPFSRLAQLFFTMKLAVLLVLGGLVTTVGLAVIRGFAVAQAIANSGDASVGKVSLPEQPRAAEINDVVTIIRKLLISSSFIPRVLASAVSSNPAFHLTA
jgi:hypothetical protein